VARIQRETNPVKKAKYQVRLGRMKLQQAIGAYDGSNIELGAQLLSAHVELMQEAWQTLRASGRNAARNSDGFKELEIALREEGRRLEDLKHRVSYFNRPPVEKAAKEIGQVHAEVIQVLFPAIQRRPKDQSFVPAIELVGRGR
jgi:hypothetical protein